MAVMHVPQVYTWMDATLRELTDLVKEVQPAARRVTARLEFALVYPDRKGRNVMRQVGVVFSTRESEDDFKTLRQINFQVRTLLLGNFEMAVGVLRGGGRRYSVQRECRCIQVVRREEGFVPDNFQKVVS